MKIKTYRDEKDVKREIKRLLDKFGWFWWMPPANGFGKAGISDINTIKDGVFMAIEAKFGSNKPTVMQRAFLESVRTAGGYGFVVNEKNIDALEIFLTDFQEQTELVRTNQQMSNEAGARMVDALRVLMALA
jgi:Holliday junction resolvase